MKASVNGRRDKDRDFFWYNKTTDTLGRGMDRNPELVKAARRLEVLERRKADAAALADALGETAETRRRAAELDLEASELRSLLERGGTERDQILSTDARRRPRRGARAAPGGRVGARRRGGAAPGRREAQARPRRGRRGAARVPRPAAPRRPDERRRLPHGGRERRRARRRGRRERPPRGQARAQGGKKGAQGREEAAAAEGEEGRQEGAAVGRLFLSVRVTVFPVVCPHSASSRTLGVPLGPYYRGDRNRERRPPPARGLGRRRGAQGGDTRWRCGGRAPRTWRRGGGPPPRRRSSCRRRARPW